MYGGFSTLIAYFYGKDTAFCSEVCTAPMYNQPILVNLWYIVQELSLVPIDSHSMSVI